MPAALPVAVSLSHRSRYSYQANSGSFERFSLVLFLASTLGHEIVTDFQTIHEKAVPSVFDRCDDSLVADSPDGDAFHAFGQADFRRKPDSLSTVVDKNGRNSNQLYLL